MLETREIPSLQPFPDHKIASQLFVASSFWLRWYPGSWCQFLAPSLTQGNLCNLLPLEVATGSEVTWGSRNWKAFKNSEITHLYLCAALICNSLGLTLPACRKYACSFAFSHLTALIKVQGNPPAGSLRIMPEASGLVKWLNNQRKIC